MRLIIFFSLFLTILFSEEGNVTKLDVNETALKQNLKSIQEQLKYSNYIVKYNRYLQSKKLAKELEQIDYELKKLNRKYKTTNVVKKIETYEKKKFAIETRLEIVGKSDASIFNNIVSFEELPQVPVIDNPFSIFSGFSYVKTVHHKLEAYDKEYEEFKNILSLLREEFEILAQLHQEGDEDLGTMKEDFNLINQIYKVKLSSLNSQAQSFIRKAEEKIEAEFDRLQTLIITIIVIIIIFWLLKILFKKYPQGESGYIINKTLNFMNITVVILVIAFFYIENATYLITILGFASAGIAIAMKDWFMNIFGWFVILVNSNIKVGDRVRIILQNGQIDVIGDIVDITLTRMVIHEDVTYVSYTKNRRAGRIIFVPNNVIFTNPIFNYTHGGLRSVWDGIDVTITFDSNHKKAVYLAKEIIKKYSKGYTDLTRKQLNSLRNVYNLKNTNVEPRIYTFIEDNGICLSCWYLNSYLPLTLRSKISSELVDAFNKEEDIKIAYPTQNVRLSDDRPPFED